MKKKQIKIIEIVLLFYFLKIILISCKSIKTNVDNSDINEDISSSYILEITKKNKNWIDSETNYFFIKNLDSLTSNNFNKYLILFDGYIGVKNCCNFLSKNNNKVKNKLDILYKEYYNSFDIGKIFKKQNRISFITTETNIKTKYTFYKAIIKYCECTSEYTYAELKIDENKLFVTPFKITPIKTNKIERKHIHKIKKLFVINQN